MEVFFYFTHKSNYYISPTINVGLISKILNRNINYLLEIAACAAARRAIGTRNGEHDT